MGLVGSFPEGWNRNNTWNNPCKMVAILLYLQIVEEASRKKEREAW